jgi:hypothetical protein
MMIFYTLLASLTARALSVSTVPGVEEQVVLEERLSILGSMYPFLRRCASLLISCEPGGVAPSTLILDISLTRYGFGVPVLSEQLTF